MIRNQTYPHSRFEVIIVDDGTDKVKDLIDKSQIPQLKYYSLPSKIPLGQKRNFSHTLIDPRTKYIAYFDDDDYQSPSRISHSVEMLEKNPEALCAGSSEMYIYFKHIRQMYKLGPYGPNHATAGTFMFRTSLLNSSHYEDTACLGEEGFFLKNFSVPFVQLDPIKTILIFSHEHNTFDKRKLLLDAPNPCCQPSVKTIEEFITLPQENVIHKFFVQDVDEILSKYEPGETKHKPDVLKRIKEIDLERENARVMRENQPIRFVFESPGHPPRELSPQHVIQLIQQQQKHIALLIAHAHTLELKLRENNIEVPPTPSIA